MIDMDDFRKRVAEMEAASERLRLELEKALPAQEAFNAARQVVRDLIRHGGKWEVECDGFVYQATPLTVDVYVSKPRIKI